MQSFLLWGQARVLVYDFPVRTVDGAYIHIRVTASFVCQEYVLRCQARQLLEERVRGASLQRGLGKVLHTAERERATARAAAARELCAHPRLIRIHTLGVSSRALPCGGTVRAALQKGAKGVRTCSSACECCALNQCAQKHMEAEMQVYITA